MHLHQQIGHSHHCAGGEQQFVALPPQWVPETQLCTDQHCFISNLQKSHIAQTDLTMPLYQHIGCTCHGAGGGQQSVALPPQLPPEIQLQIDVSTA